MSSAMVATMYLYALFAAWLCLLPLTAAAAEPTPIRGGTAIFALGADPTGLNRNVSTNNADGMVGCMIHEGLTDIDPSGGIIPMLAKSWTISEDGRTYVFRLQHAKWSDGADFTSDDVKFTFLEVSAKYSAVFAAAGRIIEAIDTPAPDEVEIHLRQPYGPLLLSLPCTQGGAILPAHRFRGTDILHNPELTTPTAGMGPFMLKEWIRGDHLRLVRNPNYWEPGRPYLDEVIAKIMPQPSSRTQALISGDVDRVSYLNLLPSDYAQISATQGLRLTPSNTPPSIGLMFFNVSKKPFDDRRVRQALFMAIDRDYLLRTGFQGHGGVGTMPFTNRIGWAANPDIDYRRMYPFDPARAGALLDEAGLKRGPDGVRLRMNMLYPTDDPDDALVSVAIKGMWRAVGVELTILPAERTVATQRQFIDRDCDTSLATYTSFGDPALGMARAFISSTIGRPFGNASGYSNKQVDLLFAQAETALGQPARGALYRQVQAILAEDLPSLTLHENDLLNGASKKLMGMDDEYFLPTWRAAWLK